MLVTTSEMIQNIQDIQDAHKRHTLWPEGQKLHVPASSQFIYIHPLWAEFQTLWPSLLSTVHEHKCYHTAKGSEISAYRRNYSGPLLPSYHRKGMFPCWQGAVELKAVSVSLAEHPVCKQHISTFPIVAALTLQKTTKYIFKRHMHTNIHSIHI